MRIATYNVEWFASLFDQDNKLIYGNSWSGRHNVTKFQQTKALGAVFKAVDADAFMIIEAPNSGGTQSCKTALENFARRYRLRQKRALVGFENETQQEIALLYDPKVMDVNHDPLGDETDENGSADAPRFDGVFCPVAPRNIGPKKVTFSKPPLEVSLNPKGDGPTIRLIGVHAKSKAPHGAKTKKQEYKISIENRRKQLAQCAWIRARVDQHLKRKEHLIVLGDFNDGPGLDKYERVFGQSGVEQVLGSDESPKTQMFDPHAMQVISPQINAKPTSSRFYDHRSKTYLNALLDYIMVSPKLNKMGDHKWVIWHPFNHPKCFENRRLREALLTASDHFPVTIDLDF